MTDFIITAEAIFLTPFAGGMTFLGILAVWAVLRKEKADRTRRDLNAATMHHVTRCGARSPEGWFCDRDRDHDPETGHADSTKGAELGRARWFDGRAA